jgi:hypothetical protein
VQVDEGVLDDLFGLADIVDEETSEADEPSVLRPEQRFDSDVRWIAYLSPHEGHRASHVGSRRASTSAR